MSRLASRAEAWEQAYEALRNTNFATFDYATVKQSLLDYLKLHFAESFNDFIESSEMVAIVESFAYIAELLAYRLDANAHENFITTAQRKDSILRLARLVSYTASRPLPARGLVRITSVSTSQSILDASGNELANKTIRWNDDTNSVWKNQFLLVMNAILGQPFGTVGPSERFQLQDVLFELYPIKATQLNNGVMSYTATIDGSAQPMELVPTQYDSKYGIIERRPQNGAPFTILYGADGLGDSSLTTGFFCYTKQGTLQRFRTTFDGVTPNQTYDVPTADVNDTDIWLNAVDPATGDTLDVPTSLPYRREVLSGKTGEWVQVDLAHAQNVIFNTNPRRNKYEVETRDNNRVRLTFGDGEFADIPSGTFDVWVRTSLDRDTTVQQGAVADVPVSFSYIDPFGRVQTFTMTISLLSSLQNGSAAEDLEHIRTTAPAVYYSQDRMVNGEDYNVFMLQDPSILKLRSVNRTFAGESKYMSWYDASGSYENVKHVGTDGVLYFDDVEASDVTQQVDINELITNHIQPLLSSTDVFMQLTSRGVSQSAYSRTFSVTELGNITTALSDPPYPVTVDLYYNTNTNTWTPVKRTVSPDTLVGWNTDYIQTPIISVTQTSAFDTRYAVTRMARRLVMHSSSTAFWNTNSGDVLLDYDTQRDVADEITILAANTNHNRTNILTNPIALQVLGTETFKQGDQAGVVDPTKLSVLTVDTDNDGVADGLDPLDPQLRGLAALMSPKLKLTVPATIPAFVGVNITLPSYYFIDPTDPDTTPDVTITYNNTPLTLGVDWIPAYQTGTYASNQIVLFDQVYTKAPIGGVLDVTMAEYVYFTRSSSSSDWTPVDSSADSIQEFARDSIVGSSLWTRKQGRSGINFVWQHYTPRYHLVDPSPTNIIDAFVVTKGYYANIQRWLAGVGPQPTPPTPLELRSAYGYLLDNKMVSDTVILRPGTIKVLFGKKALPAVQGAFKVVRTADRSMTDNQIKTTIVNTVRSFFDVTKWEFGETFYFTELAAAIHAALPVEISSVVLVPTMSTNQFGSLFQVVCGEHEIPQAHITVDDIEIVTGLTSTNLKIGG